MKDEFYYSDYDYDTTENDEFEAEMNDIWGDFAANELEDFYEGND